MVPQPRCINRIRGKVILKDTTKDAVASYVKENCPEYYLVPPGFSFRGVTLLLGEPMPLGLKRKKKKILVPFVKPCFGPILVEVDAKDGDFEYLREALGSGGGKGA
ncbi:MAG: DUF1894 domain-containing protein [Methanolinea sp.]|jgi:hypothetical protein|nr:DUF1894 domain-containing protein [Methanolinea sp.]